ncbi:MAG: hypothetical protein R3C05_21370 [Pirellulaceae bacterium]
MENELFAATNIETVPQRKIDRSFIDQTAIAVVTGDASASTLDMIPEPIVSVPSTPG